MSGGACLKCRAKIHRRLAQVLLPIFRIYCCEYVHTINSTGNANVPASTYAKVIVDSAVSLMRSNGVGERPNSSVVRTPHTNNDYYCNSRPTLTNPSTNVQQADFGLLRPPLSPVADDRRREFERRREGRGGEPSPGPANCLVRFPCSPKNQAGDHRAYVAQNSSQSVADMPPPHDIRLIPPTF
jgi:hypothetical protein